MFPSSFYFCFFTHAFLFIQSVLPIYLTSKPLQMIHFREFPRILRVPLSLFLPCFPRFLYTCNMDSWLVWTPSISLYLSFFIVSMVWWFAFIDFHASVMDPPLWSSCDLINIYRIKSLKLLLLDTWPMWHCSYKWTKKICNCVNSYSQYNPMNKTNPPNPSLLLWFTN